MALQWESGKSLQHKHEDPGLNSISRILNPGLGGRHRQFPRAHMLVSLAHLANIFQMKDPTWKNKVDTSEKWR